MDLPKSFLEAKLLGAKHYFTGKPCTHGHIARRFTSNHGCEECLYEGHRKRYQANPEKYRAFNREYVKNNPEANRERTRAWQEKNPDEFMVATINASAKKRGANERITVEEWREVIQRFGARCVCCGSTDAKLGADHVVPLARGGRNVIDNIQPMCRPCNQKKHAKDTDYRGGVA